MSSHAPETATPVVRTAHGPVEGVRVGTTAVFRGVPYGAPATGPRRFAPPEVPEPWTEELDCTRPGPAAPQLPSVLETSLGAEALAFGEDCLRLNVFSPDLDADLPVMVWFHGGGFETGTIAMSWYDGVNLARRGVVVVSVAYRLGALGYLDLPDAPGRGCWGLLDQIAGLRWVRDNVAAFGGDPSRVTVFGESAGAMSIGALLGAPGGQGLFHRAILQSGSTHNVHPPEHARKVAERYADAAGVDITDLEALRALPLDAVMRAQGALRRTDGGTLGLPWQPVLGSDEVPRPPIEAVRDGSAAGVALLLGTTLEEMKLFPLITPSLAAVDEEQLIHRTGTFESLMGRDRGSMLAAYGERTGGFTTSDRWLALLTDLVFRIPAIRLAEAQAASGAPVHMYLFAERADVLGGALGSCHALDLPYSWDNLDAPGGEILIGTLSEARRTLARRMADCWTSFAKGAEDPSPQDMPAWPIYDAERRPTMWLQADRVEVVDDPMGDERAWWDGLGGGVGFDLPISV